MALSAGFCRQFLATSCVNLALIVAGTELGWPSPVVLAVKERGEPMNMTDSEIAVMVSAIYFGNMLSPIPSGMLMESIGRKTALHLLTIIPIVSWILVYAAETPMFLHIARLLAGFWLGVVNTIVPLYVAEISEPKVRGLFSTIFQMMMNFGVLLVFYVGSLVDYYNLTYILGVLPIVMATTLFYMPESPYWYVKKGKHNQAVKALSWLRCKKPDEVKEELTHIENTVTQDSRKGTSYSDLFGSKGNRRALIIVQVLAILQRSSGISALLAYTSITLPNGVGVLSINDCVTVMGVVLTLSVLLSTFLVDKSGRKPLLVASTVGAGISMFVAGLWFFLNSNTDVNVQPVYWLPFVCFLVYSVFFSFGLGPLATTIQGEMFQTSIKGLASGVTSISLAVTSFVMNMIYYKIADDIGMYLNYWIFTVSCVIAVFFSIFYVVETKGKSLYQIQKELNKELEEKSIPL